MDRLIIIRGNYLDDCGYGMLDDFCSVRRNDKTSAKVLGKSMPAMLTHMSQLGQHRNPCLLVFQSAVAVPYSLREALEDWYSAGRLRCLSAQH